MANATVAARASSESSPAALQLYEQLLRYIATSNGKTVANLELVSVKVPAVPASPKQPLSVDTPLVSALRLRINLPYGMDFGADAGYTRREELRGLIALLGKEVELLKTNPLYASLALVLSRRGVQKLIVELRDPGGRGRRGSGVRARFATIYETPAMTVR